MTGQPQQESARAALARKIEDHPLLRQPADRRLSDTRGWQELYLLVLRYKGFLQKIERRLESREDIRLKLFNSSVPVPKVLRMPGTPGRWWRARAAGTYSTWSTSALAAWVIRLLV